MRTKAFTFFELLVILSIVGIITAIIFGSITGNNTYTVDDQEVKVVDGCEYIVNYSYGANTVLTHKGNCTNEIHRVLSPEKY